MDKNNLPANVQQNEQGFLKTVNPNQAQSLMNVEANKGVAEIQAAYVMAKRDPRDELAAIQRISNACKRKSFAEKAMYVYPKGGQKVTGPSIRMAEVLAQCWGNIRTGVQEVSRDTGETVMRAYCMDLETNFSDEKTFTIEHVVDTRGGRKELEDQRSIYENNANFAARRKRACILGVIPPDIVADAIEQCEKTLAGDASIPIQDRLKKMVIAFSELGVTKEMIQKRLGHNLENVVSAELVELSKIFTSIRDGMGNRDKFFDIGPVESDLNDKFAAGKGDAAE